MRRKIVIISIICLLFFTVLSMGQYQMNFHIPNFPPYTYEENGVLKGIAIDMVSEVLEKAGISYNLVLVPNFGRALEDLIRGTSDGFFLASQNAARDEVAVFSETITLNNWSWFVLANSDLDPNSSDFIEKARTGSIINTNTHIWLTNNGYQVSGTPSDSNTLIRMLKADRINAIFMAEAVFYEAVDLAEEPRDTFIATVQIATPFGIYVSKAYLEKYPEIIEKINEAILELYVNDNEDNENTDNQE